MSGRSHLFHALFAGLVVFVIHAVSPISQSGDSRWTVPAILRLLSHGDVRLDDSVSLWTPETLYGIECVGPGGEVRRAAPSGCPDLFHAYPRYPVATIVMEAPVFYVLDRLAPLIPPVTPAIALLAQRRYGQVYRIAEIWLASFVVSLAAIFVFLSIPLRPAAWFWTMAFAFGSSAWSTASRATWSHGMSILLLAAALYLLTRKPRLVLWAGILLGLAVWNRPLNIVPLLCLAVWLHRDGLRLLLGAAAISAPFVLYCLVVYRMPVQPYFLQGNAYDWSIARALTVVVGQLVSPGRGLLVYSPFLLLLPLGIVRWWRKDRGLVLALLAWFICHAAIISFFGDWTGGISYGPRYWTDILPGLFLLLGAIWPPRRWMAALVLIAVLIHARGAADARMQQWNQRWQAGQVTVWDWRNAPFLAGITW